jgi:hypothetical protein
MAVYSKLTADQGSDFTARVQLVDATDNKLDLTGYTIIAAIKKSYAASTTYSMTVNIVDIDQGVISINVSNSVTSSMKAGRYVYDVVAIASGGTKTRVLEGQFEITAGVTS